MRRRIVPSTLALTIILAASGLAVPLGAAGHSWANYCTTGPGLLNIREDQNNQGAADSSCNDDNNWGDSTGDIRSFHDKMSSYHLRDDPNTPPVCVKFYFNEEFSGGIDFRDGTSGHLIEDYVGAANNDRVDSHKLDNATGC